jgi:hypothetical protein
MRLRPIELQSPRHLVAGIRHRGLMRLKPIGQNLGVELQLGRAWKARILAFEPDPTKGRAFLQRLTDDPTF